ncbi:hypothetical protein FRB94_004970 [Tulasnella sp. JGI-2019a]|nr:hypothetical protein FRB93_009616 [Tulasnella sp. JGI-2019a]KAG9012824.1 hypothetical protein FRB94_004970 [Tulasnella sp. JGI-2019a]KAG9037590.1 hypothetical protein FRB95_004810 [Tulasnella sp. JGI-2019a]
MSTHFIQMPHADTFPPPTKKDELTKLPDIVESERQGWIVSAQAAAVVAALLCGVEASLLSLIKANQNDSSVFRFLLILSYSAMILNASATIASLVMLDCLGDIPVRVANPNPDEKKKKLAKMSTVNLEDFTGCRWTWARRHCLGTLFLGCVCILTQVVVYTWLREATSVATVMSVVCMFGASPLVMLLLPG